MPKIDLTITISVIVAIAAIVSPVLTAIFNNRHQLKLKHLELKQQQYEQSIVYKRTILENYLKGLSALSHRNNTSENRDLYSKNYPLALMYVPEDVQVQMSFANECIYKNKYDDLLDFVDDLSSLISNELKKL